MTATRLMLGRRPDVSAQQQAFGHVALNAGAQQEVEAVVSAIVSRAISSKPVTYDPDDAPQAGEVMTRALSGIDQEFQQAAAWSLERAATAVAKQGKPAFIGKAEIQGGGWTFYTLRAGVDGKAATVIRATSPTRALKHGNRVITRFVGGELRPMKDPLIGVDLDADAVIVGGTVYIFQPQRLERLLIDADEIKARAPQIVAKFAQGIIAPLSTATATWVEKACSQNSNVGRRVERLSRTGALSVMTVAKLRAGMPAAKLSKGAFGTKASTIDLGNLDHAIALVDIAADLYYQPRFETTSRKVASFRRLT
jgi:hypothetical protein